MAQTRTVGKHATHIGTFPSMLKISGQKMSFKETHAWYVCYHHTRVVMWNIYDRRVQLDSGGWRTRTTKVRMNQAASEFGLNYSVWADKGEWYVSFAGDTFDFEDGMILWPGEKCVTYSKGRKIKASRKVGMVPYPPEEEVLA